MFIGVYLCSSGLILAVSLLLLMITLEPTKTWQYGLRRLRQLLLTAIGLSGLGLFLFISLSAVTGILPVGGAGSYRLPHDYVEYGVFGWLILFIGVLGILSPAFAAIWNRSHK